MPWSKWRLTAANDSQRKSPFMAHNQKVRLVPYSSVDATGIAIGAIVRLMDTDYVDNPLAVVVPTEWADADSNVTEAFTRILEPNKQRAGDQNNQGGWWIGGNQWPFEVMTDDEVPDHIHALAMRCLLDSSFVPDISVTEGEDV